MVDVIREGGSWSGELEVFDQNLNRRPTSAVVMGLFDDAGELEAFAAIFRDIEERKALESRLAFEAGHDLLTRSPQSTDALPDVVGIACCGRSGGGAVR